MYNSVEETQTDWSVECSPMEKEDKKKAKDTSDSVDESASTVVFVLK